MIKTTIVSVSVSVFAVLTFLFWSNNVFAAAITGNGTSTYVSVFTGAATITGFSNFVFTSSTLRLGILTASPRSTLSIAGGPPQSSTSTLILLDTNFITGGSVSGTYIGANPSAFNGDFINFEVASSSKFRVASSGSVTVANLTVTGLGYGVMVASGSTQVSTVSPGSSGNVLTSNGSAWTSAAATGPAGSNTQVQFNNGGAFGADSAFTYTSSTKKLALNAPTSSVQVGSTANFIQYIAGNPAPGIAFDSASEDNQTNTSHSLSHTATGNNLVAFIGLDAAAGDVLTGITYDGNPATFIGKEVIPSNGSFEYLYYYIAPPTGAKNIVASFSVSTNSDLAVATYTNVSQTTSSLIDSFAVASGTGTGATLTTNVVGSNAWLFETVGNAGGLVATAGAGTAIRAGGSAGGGVNIADSSGTVGTGNQSLIQNWSGSHNYAGVIASFLPFGGTASPETTSTSLTATSSLALAVGGHILTGSAVTASSTASSCGSSPYVNGNDEAGFIKVGSGSPTSCTLNFKTAYQYAPVCVANDNSGILAIQVQTATSTATFSAASSMSGATLGYICLGL
jgi:hypothetical protein